MTTRRTEFPIEGAAGAGFLVPGGLVGDGRYRLLAQMGVDLRAATHLWRARDGQLRRDVALTILVGDPADEQAHGAARRTLDQAAHAARLTHPGMSRVLDVLSVGNGLGADEGLLGIVVADWWQGTDLVDLVGDHPLPSVTACRLLEPLASAVELAHHAGLVLGVDHPQRIRVTPEGTLRLAFPGPVPDATLSDDVRGLGGVLYLLLTGRWPLPGSAPGVPQAPVGQDGMVLAPATMLAHVSYELSSAAMRSLSDSADNGIRTSAGLIRVLDRVLSSDEQTMLIAPIPAVAGAPAPTPIEDDGTVWTTRRPSQDPSTKRKLAIGVAALGVATLVVLVWIGMQLVSFFGDDTAAAGGPKASVTGTPGSPSGSNPAQPVPAGPIRPAAVKVFNIKGTPDSPNRANRAVDGDPKTGWKTDKYNQPFPTLKPGVGLIASFAEAVRFAQIAVDSPSNGTVVEIRTAPTEKPDLADTKLIGTKTLAAGSNQIDLTSAEPSQYVLIWITKLGDGNQSEIDELAFTRAQ